MLVVVVAVVVLVVVVIVFGFDRSGWLVKYLVFYPILASRSDKNAEFFPKICKKKNLISQR